MSGTSPDISLLQSEESIGYRFYKHLAALQPRRFASIY